MLLPSILDTISKIDSSNISEERKKILNQLIDFIQTKITNRKVVSLNFICTHNSRRSHLSQVWAQALATFFKIPNVFCYSGGTEATAMYHMSAKTLANQGFEIQTIAEGKNPIYSIKYSEYLHPIIGFSKTFDNPFNPSKNFSAIMTCSSADEGCPFISGAEKRIPLTFEDPKVFDNTSLQKEKYIERSLEIATELHYVFSKIKIN